MKKKVLIATLGCKVNQYESAAFKAGFENEGFEVVTSNTPADIVVVNTCAVTGSAGAQSRQVIRKFLRKNPDATVVITGCYGELLGEAIQQEKELAGRDFLVIGNSKKDVLVAETLNSKRESSPFILGDIGKSKTVCHLPLQRFGQRSRAYLRVQDGCESFCSYCIVPYTRGPSRSVALKDVLDQARIFADQGHREIVLTGIHLGHYGKDLRPRENIATLLDRLTLSTPQVFYRISSLEPLEITDELLILMQDRPNIQPHLHIPLQSGHDVILKKMNRRYTTDQFREVILRSLDQIPNLALGIDILAGFPGETDEQFQEARDFLETLDFTYLHVFPYSVRPGTSAASMPDQVPKHIKERRVAILRELSENKRKIFYKKHLGQTRTVLIERKRDSQGRLKGFTDNYIDIRFEGPDALLGDCTRILLVSLHEDFVIGKRIEPNES